MKKTIKVSGSEGGFKTVVSRKKRKGSVLEESIDNKGVVAKALGVCSWGFETGNTMESESIDMKEECLVEETSVDYNEYGTFAGGDLDQTPKDLCVKTKKVLGKPLGVIDYDTVDTEDDILDDSLFLLSSLPVKLSIQVPVCKSFTLDIDLVVVAGKSSQEKVNFVRKIFLSVNGFGRASTPSKFGGIIQAFFTSEKTMMAAAQLANNCGVVVNTNLKHPINNHMNWAIMLKKIPVETSIEEVHAAISEFGCIKSIKMQLVGLWQKAIIELEDQIQADLLAAKWSILIGKNAVCVAQADVDKQTWNARDEFRALLYTLPMGTNTYDLWDFIGSVSGKTCVIEYSSAMANTPVIKSVGLQWSHLTAVLCLICKTSGHTSLACRIAGVFSSPRSKRAPLLAQDQFCLVKIYEKKFASVSHSLAFLTVNGELENCLKNIESSLVSLVRQIGKLTKSLALDVSCQKDIIMKVSSGDATSDKTAAILGLTASPEVVKLENMLEGLSASVMSLSACLDSLALAGGALPLPLSQLVVWYGKLLHQDDIICWHKDMDNLVSIFTESKLKGKVHSWLANKFDGVQVFTSGLDSGFLDAGVLIVMNSSLAKHIYKISEVLGQLLSIKLLFKNKLSAGEINSLIAKAINESSFVILGSDFNKDGLHKCASFKKCFDLGLINSLRGSSFVKSPTWYNSCGITKTIDYMFVSSNLVGVVVDCGVDGVEEYFDTNHKTVYVFVGLDGLLNVQLNSLHKQANRDCWKYDVKNTNKIKWSEFRNATAANAVMFLDEFVVTKQFSDLDAMWDIVYKVIILLAGGMFKKKWFRSFDCVFNKVSSWFHKLELLVSKLVKAFQLVFGEDFVLLLDIWNRLNSVSTSPVRFLFFSGAGFDAIHSGLAKTRKSYRSSKLLESKCAEESSIRQAIKRRIESFEVDKSHTIKSVLEHPFCKVVLDHLVDGRELVLEPKLVKSKVDGIMESWTRKCVVASDIFGDWTRQFLLLDHVFNGAFSDIMYSIGFDEMFGIISNLPDEKAAGLSGILNKL
ncbi:hypothetical protein G9A89_003644 [Geosiphon pyriformis]|nr:hypothetical protein G9A89_003644 [Geosiphon pyriformis]